MDDEKFKAEVLSRLDRIVSLLSANCSMTKAALERAYPDLMKPKQPPPEQGEALAIGPDGRVYLSTEGELSDVLVVDLPEVVREGTSAAGGGPTAEPEPPPREAPDQQAGSGATEPVSGGGASYLAVPAAVLGAAGLAFAVRASRRRSRRTP